MSKHPFRFEKGDKVRHATWRGFTGTVLRGSAGGGLFVDWAPMRVGGEHGGDVRPSAFPANFEIEHVEDEA